MSGNANSPRDGTVPFRDVLADLAGAVEESRRRGRDFNEKLKRRAPKVAAAVALAIGGAGAAQVDAHTMVEPPREVYGEVVFQDPIVHTTERGRNCSYPIRDRSPAGAIAGGGMGAAIGGVIGGGRGAMVGAFLGGVFGDMASREEKKKMREVCGDGPAHRVAGHLVGVRTPDGEIHSVVYDRPPRIGSTVEIMIAGREIEHGHVASADGDGPRRGGEGRVGRAQTTRTSHYSR